MTAINNVFDTVFDNKLWVDQHLEGRFSRDDHENEHLLFFVSTQHPHSGSAVSDDARLEAFFIENRTTITIQDAARFAHAMDVFCFEAMGSDPTHIVSNCHLNTLNSFLRMGEASKAFWMENIDSGSSGVFLMPFMTTFAYIALHHSDKRTRQKYERAFDILALRRSSTAP